MWQRSTGGSPVSPPGVAPGEVISRTPEADTAEPAVPLYPSSSALSRRRIPVATLFIPCKVRWTRVCCSMHCMHRM